ncbi:MAG: right-handed parallel beta-helix repeat-containing protein [Promethearchaeota archaeon]
MIREKSSLLFVCGLICLIFSTVITDLNTNKTVTLEDHCNRDFDPDFRVTFISHSEIIIHNDTDFHNQAIIENWEGSGIITDPYVISNYNITSRGGAGIQISNTSVFFQLENNIISNSTDSEIGAFHLEKVTNGILINNTAKNCYRGFYLNTTDGITITRNHAESNTYGYNIINSNNTVINRNTAKENFSGFYWDRGTNNEIINNSVQTNTYGFFLFDMWQSTINENTATRNNDGYYLQDLYNCTFKANYAENHTQRGLFMFSVQNCTFSRNIVTKSQSHGVSILYCRLNSFKKNWVSFCNESGFYMMDGVNNSFEENMAKQNNHSGFYLHYSENNTLLQNTADENKYGFTLESSQGNFIDRNLAQNNIASGFNLISENNTLRWNSAITNKLYGVNLTSTSGFNIITWNAFFNNNNGGIQVYDSGSNNIIQFNHYDDHLTPDSSVDGYVDLPYNITGSADNKDPNPRIAPIWINDNADFIDFGFEGTGTINDPYRIEGFVFISEKTDLISIQNTTMHFNLYRNILRSNGYSGIVLSNVQHGSIINNTITYCSSGIYIQSGSKEIKIKNNLLRNNFYALYLLESSLNQLQDNLIIRNTLHGIVLTGSSSNTVIDNICIRNQGVGILMSSSANFNSIIHNIIFANILCNALDESNEGNYWLSNAFGGHPGSQPYWIQGKVGAVDLEPNFVDTDSDSIPDWYETIIGLSLTTNDSYLDLDVDGLPNIWEYLMELNATDALDADLDPDGDHFTNLEEFSYGMDPHVFNEDLPSDLPPLVTVTETITETYNVTVIRNNTLRTIITVKETSTVTSPLEATTTTTKEASSPGFELGLVIFIIICGTLYKVSLRKKPPNSERK